jgi:hypothetical protein
MFTLNVLGKAKITPPDVNIDVVDANTGYSVVVRNGFPIVANLNVNKHYKIVVDRPVLVYMVSLVNVSNYYHMSPVAGVNRRLLNHVFDSPFLHTAGFAVVNDKFEFFAIIENEYHLYSRFMTLLIYPLMTLDYFDQIVQSFFGSQNNTTADNTDTTTETTNNTSTNTIDTTTETSTTDTTSTTTEEVA